MGPNCFGVQNCDLPLNASMASGAPPGGGGITLVTQSGAYGMAIHTLGLDEQTRFAKVYAAGNKADIGDAELVRYLGADPASRTLCFFVESLPDGRAFYEAARAVTRTKPVIVAKTGRSAAGVRAARSHTAALAGSERIWRAAVDQAGMILARSGLEMMDTARALDAQPVPARPRVGIVTNSGGTGVELSDLLADEGLDVPELSAGLQDELRALLPPFASPRNPVDMTPVWSRFTELYPLLVERLARSGEVDAITGFSFSAYVSVKDRGVPVDDIVLMPMANYGLKLYGNAIIVNTRFAAEKPEAVRAFLSAFLKGMKETIRRPTDAVDSIVRRDDSAKREVELERLRMAIRDNILTPEVRANGFGAIDVTRFEEGIDQIALVHTFKAKPKPDDIFDASYLPPAAERKAN